MKKGHVDAFRKEAEHLKKKEEKTLFRIHRWEVRHGHLLGNLRMLSGVVFGLSLGAYVSFHKLVFLKDAIILTLLLLVLSYLITHHNRRRMFNRRSLMLTLDHTLTLYAISVVLLSLAVWLWPDMISSYAEMLLTMSVGVFFGSIFHSYF